MEQNEIKKARFEKVAPLRVGGVIESINKLAKLTNPAVYDYEPEQAEKILSTLESELADLRTRFQNGGKLFSLSNPEPKKTFVVCLSGSYIRDAQMFDPCGLDLDEKAWEDLDLFSYEMEDRWGDCNSTNIFIGIYKADSEEEAKELAADEGYDPRCMFAVEVKTEGAK